METSNLFIAQQCDQAGECVELEQCIASGQVSAAQIEAHRVAGDFELLAKSLPHRLSEYTIANLAIKHLGSYAEKDYDFARAVIQASQDASARSARVQ